MSTDPLQRIPEAFSRVLARRYAERHLTGTQFAAAVGLSENDLIEMESGRREPTLTEFIRIANVLREEPCILLVELIAAWRAHDAVPMYRASDFTRLYRLGYHHKPGDFREQDRTYDSFAEAANAAARLNQLRYERRVRLLDTLCVYIRVKHIGFEWAPHEVAP